MPTEEQVNAVVTEAREAWTDKKLLLHANNIAHMPPGLRDELNSYPNIPFTITIEDVAAIRQLRDGPGLLPDDHQWTPWEKIFYAILWKDSKLKSIGRIIEGAEEALANRQPVPTSSAVVYHYFGRHLTDLLNEPILDQHSVRAQRLMENQEPHLIQGIRQTKLPTAAEARRYHDWFREIIATENITSYEESRVIDRFLYALGKFAKLG